MPLNISKPQLQSATKLTAFDLTKIHFGRSALQSVATDNPANRSSSDKLQ